MKQLLLVFAIFIFSKSNVYCQVPNGINWDALKIGYFSSSNNDATGGFFLGTEFSLDLYASLSGGIKGDWGLYKDKSQGSSKIKLMQNYMFIADYKLFGEGEPSPFIGLGVGVVSFGGKFAYDTANINQDDIHDFNNVANLRFGYDSGKIKFLLDYNHGIKVRGLRYYAFSIVGGF